MLEMPSCTSAACPWASQPERLSTDVLKAAVQASIAAAFGLSRGDLPLHRRLQVALVLAVAAGSLSSAFEVIAVGSAAVFGLLVTRWRPSLARVKGVAAKATSSVASHKRLLANAVG